MRVIEPGFDTTRGIVDWPDDYVEAIATESSASGKGRSGKVGDAPKVEEADAPGPSRRVWP